MRGARPSSPPRVPQSGERRPRQRRCEIGHRQQEELGAYPHRPAPVRQRHGSGKVDRDRRDGGRPPPDHREEGRGQAPHARPRVRQTLA